MKRDLLSAIILPYYDDADVFNNPMILYTSICKHFNDSNMFVFVD